MAVRKDSEFCWCPPKTVKGISGDALDNKLKGKLVPAPKRGDSNSSLGILQWPKHKEEIVASSVFHKDKGILRKTTPREMGRILDYIEGKSREMTEEQIELLTKNEESLGKIIYNVLFLLCSMEIMKKGAGLSGKGIRKAGDDSEVLAPVEKRIKITELSPDCKEDKVHPPVIKDLLEDEDLQLEQKEVEDEEEGGEPSAKAVKADNLKVPVHLWNGRVAQKLMAYWKEKGLVEKKWQLEKKGGLGEA